MRAATRESTRERMISIMALVLVISIGSLVPKAAAQSHKYPKMAPVDQYLMERNAEILLAERRPRFHIQRRDVPGQSNESCCRKSRIENLALRNVSKHNQVAAASDLLFQPRLFILVSRQ
jgi:hypothetical protein